MKALLKSYGLGLTSLFIGLTVVWIAVLIILPQVRMIDRAFTHTDRAGAAANLALEIDRLYTRVFEIDLDLDDLQVSPPEAEPATTPGVPSLVPSPALVPSPSAPAPALRSTAIMLIKACSI